jgi:hypothetical protein
VRARRYSPLFLQQAYGQIFNDDGVLISNIENYVTEVFDHKRHLAYLKVEAVGVSLEVISTGLHEKTLLHLTLQAL